MAKKEKKKRLKQRQKQKLKKPPRKAVTKPQSLILHPDAKVTLHKDHFRVYAFNTVTIKAGSSVIIPLGIKTELPKDHYIMYLNIADRVYPNEVYIHPSMIYAFVSDASEDYTILKNDSDKDYTIKQGEVLVCGVILKSKFKLPKVVDVK